jgi:REP element-mobilizing transposase RayT
MQTKHKRRSIRLPQYDYGDTGAYFVTICTHERVCLFGQVDTYEGAMTLNALGRVVWDEWENTVILRDYVTLDRFVVMPNHVHGMIWITDSNNQWENITENIDISDVGAQRDINVPDVGAWRAMPLQRKFSKPIPHSLPTIIGAFKSAVTRKINQHRNTPGALVWQRNYWERVIRNENELNATRMYIATNPARWQQDKLYV